jgi:lactoylglutathione lyase
MPVADIRSTHAGQAFCGGPEHACPGLDPGPFQIPRPERSRLKAGTSGRRWPWLEPPSQAVKVAIDTKNDHQQELEFMATRLRHLAIIVPDPETAAQFFEQAFDMKRAGSGRRGIYMSDGVMNVALLKKESDDEPIGLYHFGMWVDDLAESEKKVFDAGGTYLAGRPTSPNSYYEAKYKDPLGIVFDLTHTGWIGAAKEVVAEDVKDAPVKDAHVKDAAKA